MKVEASPQQKFSDWYKDGPFAAYVRERRFAGSSTVRLIAASQPAGDLSDPPTTDVVLAMARHTRFRIRTDYGASRAVTDARHATCFLRPPNTAASIFAEDVNDLRFFAFSVEAVRPLVQGYAKAAEAFDFGRLHACGFRDALIEKLCDALWLEAAHEDGASRLYCDHAVSLLFAELHRQAARPTPDAKGGLAPP